MKNKREFKKWNELTTKDKIEIISIIIGGSLLTLAALMIPYLVTII
jgi:hypothetical protein